MIENLTKKTFIEKISELGEFKYKGNKPAMIDFWAPWCGPCRMVGPIVEELANEYAGKIDIYKVNVDDEGELAEMFAIQSIPSIMFIPVDGQPQVVVGAIPKPSFIEIFKKTFNI